MENQKGGLFQWIRNTSFLKFFLSWIASIFIFAIVYWLVALFSNGLILENESIVFTIGGLFRSIYASFLIATIFGMSRIEPSGMMILLVYVQLAFSIVVILILMDKLFQKYALPHYHASSSQDKKINTVMLMMSIFRQDVDRIMHEFKAKTKHHINIKEIEAIIDGLYVAFLDIEKLFSIKNIHRHRIKNVQYLMLTENIEDSVEKLSFFIDFLERHKIEWKDRSVEFWLRYILETADKIALNFDTTGIKSPKIIIAVENMRDYIEKIQGRL